jgi:ATP-dependent DNA ligase
VRNGFVPATRRMVYEKLKPLVTEKCPFVNLPETGRARWGDLLDTEKMKKCVWVQPELVAVVEFLEWTEGETYASHCTPHGVSHQIRSPTTAPCRVVENDNTDCQMFVCKRLCMRLDRGLNLAQCGL